MIKKTHQVLFQSFHDYILIYDLYDGRFTTEIYLSIYESSSRQNDAIIKIAPVFVWSAWLGLSEMVRTL